MILLGTINGFLNWNKLHKVSFSFQRYIWTGIPRIFLTTWNSQVNRFSICSLLAIWTQPRRLLRENTYGTMTSLRSILRKLDKDDIMESIVVSNIPPGTKEEALVIHFQQRKHGGGDVSAIKLTQNGDNAIITFEDEESKLWVDKFHVLPYLISFSCPLDDRR